MVSQIEMRVSPYLRPSYNPNKWGNAEIDTGKLQRLNLQILTGYDYGIFFVSNPQLQRYLKSSIINKVITFELKNILLVIKPNLKDKN